ncbi:hypothetical protein [Mycoplasma sp. Ms02]|uniref:hypothetical protein n=1 Tax=Mycoplasma sp. Ms02 TaxID=353851 RepID=UPI001C8AE934|nr:hypothetical protein [Mycoplasma sp. Ms02]QZE12204.1 hypothetical protein K4L35_02570 [Mycoplasma sp. Ms02]
MSHYRKYTILSIATFFVVIFAICMMTISFINKSNKNASTSVIAIIGIIAVIVAVLFILLNLVSLVLSVMDAINRGFNSLPSYYFLALLLQIILFGFLFQAFLNYRLGKEIEAEEFKKA